MNKILSILFLIVIVALLGSCNDWLDVRPDTEVKKEDLLDNFEGVRDALTGCYMALANRSLYGEKLTMTDIELLANLWYTNSNSPTLRVKLKNHTYDDEEVRTAIKSVYLNLYNVIAQVNLIIESLEKNPEAIINTQLRDVLLGEAYAIRAFCHFDVLRMFGQIPQNATIHRSLPYAMVADIINHPSYYDFNAYTDLLKLDFERAESLLEENDPLFQFTYAQLNSATYINRLPDSYLGYRQSRFNYWAVKGIQARMYLYLGGEENELKAYQIAKEIINAVGPDENPLLSLSGSDDLKKGQFACPGETLLYLSKYDILSYSVNLLLGGTTERADPVKHNLLTANMLNQDLFARRNTTSNNRFLYLWNRDAQTSQGTNYPALKKYYYDLPSGTPEMNYILYHQIVPLLRLSEIYLIAIETAPTLVEANALFKIYMTSHDENITNDEFLNDVDLKNKILDAYRIELFGEGQMFYHYKRFNSNTILWNSERLTEADYAIPLPSSEYDPNSNKN